MSQLTGMLEVVAAACHRHPPVRWSADGEARLDRSALIWLDLDDAITRRSFAQRVTAAERDSLLAASANGPGEGDTPDLPADSVVAVTPASAAERIRGLGAGVRLARGPSDAAAAAWVGRPEAFQARHPEPDGTDLDVRDPDADPIDPGAGRLLRLLAQCAPAGLVLDLGAGEGVASAWLASGLEARHRLVAVEQDSRKAGAARRRLRTQSAANGPGGRASGSALHEVLIGDARGLLDQVRRATLAFVDLPASEHGPVIETCLSDMSAGGVLVVRRPDAPGGWFGAGLRVHPRVTKSATLHTPAALDVAVLES